MLLKYPTNGHKNWKVFVAGILDQKALANFSISVVKTSKIISSLSKRYTLIIAAMLFLVGFSPV
jgi:hypothetical protein